MTSVTTASPLVATLAAALDDAAVTYCHWKSNTFIDRAERADTDLDLLVAAHQTRAFVEVMSRCGFVAADRRDVAPVPGMAHYFAYDDVVDRFVHVHAHHRLVIGHDRTKNYRLPIEEPFLASVSRDRLLPTPSVEFEYVVFVVRMTLKYAIADEVLWSAARGQRAAPTATEVAELDDLQHRLDRRAVDDIVRDHLAFIGPGLFAAAEHVMTGRTSVVRAVSVAHGMQAALEAHGRRSAAVDGPLRVWRRGAVAARRRTGTRHGFRLMSGGAVIAVVGGDGAGKSTAVDGICAWLGEHLDVLRVHLGKPPWSATTVAVRGVLKLLNDVRAVRSGGAATSPAAPAPRGPTTTQLVWYACKSRDRYRAYRRASRAASNGSIVICDRYPHPALALAPASGYPRDIAQIASATEGRDRGRLLAFLIRVEERYHRRIPLPDLTVALQLDPSEAARRKTDEPQDYVMERTAEMWSIDWHAAGVHVIDASQPADAVLAELKALIWDALS